MWQTTVIVALMALTDSAHSLMTERPLNHKQDTQKKVKLDTQKHPTRGVLSNAKLRKERQKHVPHYVKKRGVLEVCPLKNFKESLHWILKNKLIENEVASLAEASYLNYSHNFCQATPQFGLSSKKLIINVGEGTTGTRWLDNIMQDLGFHGGHNIRDLGVDGNKLADKYDYISDSPVSLFAWQLIRSHPNAIYIMTFRDPFDWQANRLGAHNDNHGYSDRVPCGKDGHSLHSELAPQTYVAYSAWIKCILPADRGRILAANFFKEDHDDAKFIDDLISFLEAHNMQTESWEERTTLVREKVSLVAKSWKDRNQKNLLTDAVEKQKATEEKKEMKSHKDKKEKKAKTEEHHQKQTTKDIRQEKQGNKQDTRKSFQTSRKSGKSKVPK